MVPWWIAIVFLALAAVWCFGKAAAEGDEFAGLVGHGIVALGCLGLFGFGYGGGHGWLWVTALAAFVVNAVFLMLRIRST